MAIPVTTLTNYYYPELPDYLQTIDELSDILKTTAPDVWASAGLFDITKFEEEEDPETGETKLSYPVPWPEEYKEYLEENPAEKTKYIIENVFPDLKKISFEHYQTPFPANIPEKWKYLVKQPRMEKSNRGLLSIVSSVSRNTSLTDANLSLIRPYSSISSSVKSNVFT